MSRTRTNLKFTVYGNTYNDIHRDATWHVAQLFPDDKYEADLDYELEFEISNNPDGGTTRKYVGTAHVRFKRQ
jgi:hypothetical protein